MVQVIPTFVMSCFKIPVDLCDEIEVLIQKYFGGKRVNKGKFIGKNGRFYVSLNLKVGWVSKIWGNLMMQCWRNRSGD